jgi:hypothetical protein
MDNVQNCDSYINIPLSQTYIWYLLTTNHPVLKELKLRETISQSALTGLIQCIKSILQRAKMNPKIVLYDPVHPSCHLRDGIIRTPLEHTEIDFSYYANFW